MGVSWWLHELAIIKILYQLIIKYTDLLFLYEVFYFKKELKEALYYFCLYI